MASTWPLLPAAAHRRSGAEPERTGAARPGPRVLAHPFASLYNSPSEGR